MENKICIICNGGKHNKDFFKKNAEHINGKTKRVSIRYSDKKDNISNQRKEFYQKSKVKVLQQRKGKYIHIKT